MKNISNLIMVMIAITTNALGQQSYNRQNPAILPDSLNIAYSKTTNLIFPYAIKSVDRGSRDVLAQKAKGLENILQIKAAQECFTETNLTVVTSDGKLYSFIVNYDEKPTVLNVSLAKPIWLGQDILFSPEILNEADVKRYSNLGLYHAKKNAISKDKKNQIEMALNGIYIHDDLMYFRIRIENKSNVGYDIGQLRFFIRDSKKASRTASQEIEINPVNIENDVKLIVDNSQHTFVFALPKFTIPEKKFLAIQLMEKSGGRHLELHVKNKKLVKVIKLPAL